MTTAAPLHLASPRSGAADDPPMTADRGWASLQAALFRDTAWWINHSARSRAALRQLLRTSR